MNIIFANNCSLTFSRNPVLIKGSFVKASGPESCRVSIKCPNELWRPALEDDKEITNKRSTMHHINSHPTPRSSFLRVSFNESLPWDQKSIPLLWEMGMGMAVMALKAFHLPGPLTCKWGLERSSHTGLWYSGTNTATHIHPWSSLPCAPGLPPYPVRTPTWGRKGETGWVKPWEVPEV